MSISASGMHIMGRYRTAVFRELGVTIACQLTRTPVLYDIKAGAFQRWFASTGAIRRMMMTYILKSAKVIICEGQTDVEFVGRRFGLKAYYFPNFVSSVSIPKTVPDKLTDSLVRILFVGYCYEGKGVFELVDGCRLAAERHIPVELTLIGQEHEDFARYLDSPDSPALLLRINRLGRLDYDETLSLFAEHDVFCMPSRHQGEGHTNTINEAMAMGMVIVSTRHGFLESVLEGDCSYFMDELTPDVIARTLEHIHRNRDRARQKARNARTRLLEHFVSDVAFAKLASHYEVLTGKTKNSE